MPCLLAFLACNLATPEPLPKLNTLKQRPQRVCWKQKIKCHDISSASHCTMHQEHLHNVLATRSWHQPVVKCIQFMQKYFLSRQSRTKNTRQFLETTNRIKSESIYVYGQLFTFQVLYLQTYWLYCLHYKDSISTKYPKSLRFGKKNLCLQLLGNNLC